MTVRGMKSGVSRDRGRAILANTWRGAFRHLSRRPQLGRSGALRTAERATRSARQRTGSRRAAGRAAVRRPRAEGARRGAHLPRLRPAGVLGGAAQRLGERRLRCSPCAPARRCVSAYAPRPTSASSTQREQHRHHRLLAPAPAQRLGQPPDWSIMIMAGEPTGLGLRCGVASSAARTTAPPS